MGRMGGVMGDVTLRTERRKATRSRMCNFRIRSAKKWVGRSDVSDSKDRRAARGRGSVGRTFPTQKNRRAARGGGSVGRTFPTHFFPRCARHGVGRSDWLRFSPRCERYRVGIERPSAQSVLRGPGERRARNRPRVRTTLIGSGLDHRTRFMTPCGAPTAV